uniref:DNA mismatch repair protein S5 domain-containing protein n=1 Tax=viral metagenome TaxID=1070528 RepID=A0A6C0D9M9_9ZZZZ
MDRVTLNRLPAGSPHFKSMYRQHKQSDYDLIKSVCEFVDNVLKCKNIHINTRVLDSRIHTITISDDANGFENMFEPGISNPFNMGHMRAGHEDNDEMSQFGIGMKAGAISTGDKMDVYTKVRGKYYHVELDFIEMCEREEDSFSPNQNEITYEHYKSKHPFEKGSTIVLSSIRHSIYTKTTQDDITVYLTKHISDIYNDFIQKGIMIYVNKNLIYPAEDIYECAECAPFTKRFEIYKHNDNYYMKNMNDTHYYEYDNKTNTIKSIDKKLFKKFVSDKSKPIAYLKTTFVYYKHLPDEELPCGLTDIYRNGRRNGSWLKNGSKNNGSKNYNKSRIDIEDKELAKLLGLTFNKNISENIKNNETSAFQLFISKSCEGLSADTSTASFKKLQEIAKNHKIDKHSVLGEVGPKPVKIEPVSKPEPVSNPEPVSKPEPLPVAQVEPIQTKPKSAKSVIEKKSTIVRTHYKNKIPLELFAEMADDIKQHLDVYSNSEFGVEIFNIWNKMKKE